MSNLQRNNSFSIREACAFPSFNCFQPSVIRLYSLTFVKKCCWIAIKYRKWKYKTTMKQTTCIDNDLWMSLCRVCWNNSWVWKWWEVRWARNRCKVRRKIKLLNSYLVRCECAIAKQLAGTPRFIGRRQSLNNHQFKSIFSFANMQHTYECVCLYFTQLLYAGNTP